MLPPFALNSGILTASIDALAIFFNTLGGAISISVAQNVFSNTLLQQIPVHAPSVDPAVIIAAGATHVREVTPAASLAGVLVAYNMAVTRAIILPIASGGIAVICSVFVSSLSDDPVAEPWPEANIRRLQVEMKSVKGKSLIPTAA